jgi:transcriptional activator HAC1
MEDMEDTFSNMDDTFSNMEDTFSNMEDTFSNLGSLPSTPAPEVSLTVSPADTSLEDPEVKEEENKLEEKKSGKKRKSWGQELPVPKTNLPPRKRAKTDDEKEQRRIERVLRNRAAAQTSRERKRLEMEKLENEKIQMEQQNQFLLQRLAQMEVENNRLSQQVAQLSAEIRGSRSNTPRASSPATASPTLTPTLFKQEGDELPLERIPFPTPSHSDYSPTLEPSTLAESSDLTQHPAAVLCDLQCQSLGLKELEVSSPSLTWDRVQNLQLQMTLQLLFLTMTSAAYSTVIHPLSQILQSLKMGSPLTFSTEDIYQHFPLILWLISTPSLSPSKASNRPTVFRMRLLTRLLACSPALARPLRDATGKALQLAVSEHLSKSSWSATDRLECRQNWESLLTLVWAIDCLERSRTRRRAHKLVSFRSAHGGRRNSHGKPRGFTRSSRSSFSGETLTSRLMGKQL